MKSKLPLTLLPFQEVIKLSFNESSQNKKYY